MSRERMPWCARVIDGLREVFGRLEINEVIRRGLKPDCEPVARVYLQENGEALGAHDFRQLVADQLLDLEAQGSGHQGRPVKMR